MGEPKMELVLVYISEAFHGFSTPPVHWLPSGFVPMARRLPPTLTSALVKPRASAARQTISTAYPLPTLPTSSDISGSDR